MHPSIVLPTLVLLFAFGLTSKAKAAEARGAEPRGEGLPLSVVETLVAPWAMIWSVPVLLLEVVARRESKFHPSAVNDTDPRAIAKGNAWGLFQITLDTARVLLAHVDAFRRFAAFGSWDGKGRSLLDPDLNTMIASWYLASLWHEFGDYPETLAAYHQGPQKVRDMIRDGREIPDELPPKGRAYVRDALAIKRELEQRYTS